MSVRPVTRGKQSKKLVKDETEENEKDKAGINMSNKMISKCQNSDKVLLAQKPENVIKKSKVNIKTEDNSCTKRTARDNQEPPTKVKDRCVQIKGRRESNSRNHKGSTQGEVQGTDQLERCDKNLSSCENKVDISPPLKITFKKGYQKSGTQGQVQGTDNLVRKNKSCPDLKCVVLKLTKLIGNEMETYSNHGSRSSGEMSIVSSQGSDTGLSQGHAKTSDNPLQGGPSQCLRKKSNKESFGERTKNVGIGLSGKPAQNQNKKSEEGLFAKKSENLNKKKTGTEKNAIKSSDAAVSMCETGGSQLPSKANLHSQGFVGKTGYSSHSVETKSCFKSHSLTGNSDFPSGDSGECLAQTFGKSSQYVRRAVSSSSQSSNTQSSQELVGKTSGRRKSRQLSCHAKSCKNNKSSSEPIEPIDRSVTPRKLVDPQTNVHVNEHVQVTGKSVSPNESTSMGFGGSVVPRPTDGSLSSQKLENSQRHFSSRMDTRITPQRFAASQQSTSVSGYKGSSNRTIIPKKEITSQQNSGRGSDEVRSTTPQKSSDSQNSRFITPETAQKTIVLQKKTGFPGDTGSTESYVTPQKYNNSQQHDKLAGGLQSTSRPTTPKNLDNSQQNVGDCISSGKCGDSTDVEVKPVRQLAEEETILYAAALIRKNKVQLRIRLKRLAIFASRVVACINRRLTG